MSFDLSFCTSYKCTHRFFSTNICLRSCPCHCCMYYCGPTVGFLINGFFHVFGIVQFLTK
jgi:hypothetical protein